MYYVGKFYGFLLFEEDDGTIRISQGSSTFKEKYKNVDEAKEQIRKWKGNTMLRKIEDKP